MKNILLVEDNHSDVELVKHALDQLEQGYSGIKLSVAYDGSEAMEFLLKTGKHTEAVRPDLVLLDVNMPKKNGHEVLNDIREHEDLTSLPVIMFTTSNQPQDISQAYKNHVNAYLTKPLELDDFFELISEIKQFWTERVTLPVHSNSV